MKTIVSDITHTVEISKSQFITYLRPIDNLNKAKAFFKEIRELHPNATHHITFYRIGYGGETGHYNDDGEPSGTAGKPVFEVLKFKDATNICGVIVRYFGGIKLGAGGLVRAYSKSISEALLDQLVEIVPQSLIKIECGYHLFEVVVNLIEGALGEILSREFSKNVLLVVKLPDSSLKVFYSKLSDCHSNIIITKLEEKDAEDWEV